MSFISAKRVLEVNLAFESAVSLASQPRPWFYKFKVKTVWMLISFFLFEKLSSKSNPWIQPQHLGLPVQI